MTMAKEIRELESEPTAPNLSNN